MALTPGNTKGVRLKNNQRKSNGGAARPFAVRESRPWAPRTTRPLLQKQQKTTTVVSFTFFHFLWCQRFSNVYCHRVG